MHLPTTELNVTEQSVQRLSRTRSGRLVDFLTEEGPLLSIFLTEALRCTNRKVLTTVSRTSVEQDRFSDSLKTTKSILKSLLILSLWGFIGNYLCGGRSRDEWGMDLSLLITVQLAPPPNGSPASCPLFVCRTCLLVPHLTHFSCSVGFIRLHDPQCH
jgi:hypothetical protein